MATYQKMIKSFVFEEHVRRDMSLDNGVRLNPEMHRLEIQTVAGYYPTTENLYAKTRLTTPDSCRGWIGFFVIVDHQKVAGEIVTSLGFKLNDGSNDLYWDGSAWSLASASDWNTEQEIAENISEYSSNSIQVIINLSTTNEGYSPFVYEVRILYNSDIIFIKDYIRSFIEDLLDNTRPISDYLFDSSGQTSIDFNKIITPYTFVDVDVVYNETADPNHFSPLSGVSFNSSTKMLTLPAQPVGNRIIIKFIWKPYVMVTQSQDYSEIGKIPVILVEDTSIDDKRFILLKNFYVINKATGSGWSLERVIQADIRLSLYFITASFNDLQNLSNEIKKYFSNTRRLRSRGQDEYFSYVLPTIFNDSTIPSQKQLYSARFIATICNALFYTEDANQIIGVNRFSVTGGNVEFEVSS